MKNVNLMAGMVGGIVTMVWTLGVFIGGMFAGVALMESTRKERNANLKVVK